MQDELLNEPVEVILLGDTPGTRVAPKRSKEAIKVWQGFCNTVLQEFIDYVCVYEIDTLAKDFAPKSPINIRYIDMPAPTLPKYMWDGLTILPMHRTISLDTTSALIYNSLVTNNVSKNGLDKALTSLIERDLIKTKALIIDVSVSNKTSMIKKLGTNLTQNATIIKLLDNTVSYKGTDSYYDIDEEMLRTLIQSRRV